QAELLDDFLCAMSISMCFPDISLRSMNQPAPCIRRANKTLNAARRVITVIYNYNFIIRKEVRQTTTWCTNHWSSRSQEFQHSSRKHCRAILNSVHVKKDPISAICCQHFVVWKSTDNPFIKWFREGVLF